jgi:hypothetical protein
MTLTLADVLQRIKEQLDWQAPNGRHMGNIVLERETAKYLYRAVIEIIKERDELVYRSEQAQQGG